MKKSIIVIFSAVMVVSSVALVAFAFDNGNDNTYEISNAVETKSLSEMTEEEVKEALANNRLPEESYTEEELNSMIEERKENRRKYAGYTEEEMESATRQEAIASNRLEEYERYKAFQESYFSTDEGKKDREEQKKLDEYNKTVLEKQMKSVLKCLQNDGYYTNGLDEQKLKREEDYELEFIRSVCNAYSNNKNNLSDEDKSNIEDYLNNRYDEITSWFPQSNESMDTYELIEKTIEVKFPSTQVERR